MAESVTLQTWYDLPVPQRRAMLAIDKGRENRKKSRVNPAAVSALKRVGLLNEEGGFTKRGTALLRKLPEATRSPHARPSEMSGTFGELASKLGGVTKLAEEIGLSVRTIQRYAAKEACIPAPTLKVLTDLAVSNGIKNPAF